MKSVRPKPRDVFENPSAYIEFLTVGSDDSFEGQHFDRKRVGQRPTALTKNFSVLSRIVWIEIQTATKEENSNSEIFKGSISSTHGFDLLNFSINPLCFCIGLTVP